MVSSYRQRRDTVIGLLGELEMTAFRPAGAFHTWVDISGSGVGAREFALALLAQERVAVAPGTAFGRGGAGFVRFPWEPSATMLSNRLTGTKP